RSRPHHPLSLSPGNRPGSPSIPTTSTCSTPRLRTACPSHKRVARRPAFLPSRRRAHLREPTAWRPPYRDLGAQPMADVRVRDMLKRYGAVTAVDHISLEIHDGELMVFLGPSGCGKTTTLRSIAGPARPERRDL